MISFFVNYLVSVVRWLTEQPQYVDCIVTPLQNPGGNIPYEKVGDACQKTWIKPLKEMNLGVALALFHTLKIALYTEYAWLPAAIQKRSPA